jgi:hypothetical protein
VRHSAIDSSALSVIVEMVSFVVTIPYVWARWETISPEVRPFAVSEITRSSRAPVRRAYLGRTCGLKVPSRSRGTCTVTVPTSVITFLLR